MLIFASKLFLDRIIMDANLIEQVWQKASKADGLNPDLIRKDCCGALILKTEFGNRNSNFGWEIDHVYPLSQGGDDNIDNLRPMQWENNASKGNDFPVYNSAVRAEGNDNIREKAQFKVNDSLVEKLRALYELEGV